MRGAIVTEKEKKDVTKAGMISCIANRWRL